MEHEPEKGFTLIIIFGLVLELCPMDLRLDMVNKDGLNNLEAIQVYPLDLALALALDLNRSMDLDLEVAIYLERASFL